jgi:hemerythrin-like metal-binding protein
MVRWRDEYASGDEQVDAAHRELLRMINELTEGIITRRGRALVEPVLLRLVAYAHQHFAEEEALMRRTGYPGAARHAAVHDQFRAKADELAAGFRNGTVVLPLTLSQFLMAWFDGHLRTEDLQLIRWVRGVAPAPEKAPWAAAPGGEAGPAPLAVRAR